MSLRILAVWSLSVACALGQGTLIREWTPPAGEEAARPRNDCAELRAMTGYEFSVISAETQGDFCRVLGLVQPEIRFEVALPSAWNKRLIMIGNGGFAGEDLESPGRLGTRNEAVKKGFVFTQTNTGHEAAIEPLGTFASNPQKLIDYAFRAVHVTAVTAKTIAERFYGARPSRSYFLGCSTGGRQALMSALRFPEDFDGILSMAPVLDFTSTMVSYARIQQAWAKAPVPIAKLKLAGEKIYALCDDKDGVKDGVIEDPRRCGFDVNVHLPKCAGVDLADCFTEGQLQSLRTLYVDVGWPVGPEAMMPNGRIGWEPWIVREGGEPIQQAFGSTFFRYLAYPKKDPTALLVDFNADRDLPRLASIRKMLDATDPDLSAFQKRGGKLLMMYGWADPALNPMMSVHYFEAAEKRMGPGIRDFFRLFMMPGVFHCAGGPGCDTGPLFPALVDWVEKGKAPDVIVGRKDKRTHPWCVYPKVAVYKGSGSTDDAANFVCGTGR